MHPNQQPITRRLQSYWLASLEVCTFTELGDNNCTITSQMTPNIDMKLARAIQEIKSSRYSLLVVQKLQENGFDFSQLNACGMAGEIVCEIVARNFGLGLKLLTACGVDLDCSDPSNGNTPLILVAAEGLCGPTRYLLDHLPAHNLAHTNTDGKSALSLLLSRAHAECGCLAALLRRLPPETSSTSAANRTILSAPELLGRIRASGIERVAGVFNLWISANFIDLSRAPREDDASDGVEVTDQLKSRTIDVVLKDCLTGCTTPGEIRTSAAQCLQTLGKLLVLGCLDVKLLQACLLELTSPRSPLDPIQLEQLDTIEKGIRRLLALFHPVAPLRALCIQRVRRHLQGIMLSGGGGAQAFQRQVQLLDVANYAQEQLLLRHANCAF